ncbi:MAG TPA: ATP-binding cassette domain-containing protein [Candidatus Tectomicrobia bacterium]|jgi:ABC-2 type transport system ATP-binding protein
MIEVDHLTKYYGPIVAIQELSFRVDTGEILGFLGPNGAGKTTTMRILSGFMPASSGRASVAGYDVFTQALEVRRRVGYLPENVPLYQEMTVGGYLQFVAEVKGIPYAQRTRKIGAVAEACGVHDLERRLISALSKGYRQRVGLAQALLNDPPVLILDEPTVGLDPRQIIEIRQIIKDLRREHTVILSTHILPEVSMTCDRVVIISGGQVVAIDTPDNLTERTQHHRRIFLEVDGPGDAVLAHLQGLKGVLQVEQNGLSPGGAPAYTLSTIKERDMRAEVAQAVVQQGWQLLELRPVRLSLEEVFIQLVTEEEEGHA